MALAESNLNLATLGNAYALSWNKEDAYKVLERLRERPQGGYVASFAVALVYLGLGEQDRAFEWLERAYTQREPWLLYFNVDPVYDSVRSDPRFTALLRKVNLKVLP